MKLGEAEKALGRIHDAIVVHHGEHEATGVGVTVYQGKGWHGESNVPTRISMVNVLRGNVNADLRT